MSNDRQSAAAAPFEPAFSSEGLREAVRHGSRRTLIAQIASHITSIVVLCALYHLIEPDRFGLIGMALPVVMFMRFFTSLGLNIATVQQPELQGDLLSVLFWMHVVLGVAVAAVTAALAPAVAWFFGEPGAGHVTLALAATSIISALGLQHIALLERTLRLGSAATSRLVGQVLGGIAAIALAIGGAGVWALVAQQYVELAGLALAAWLFEPWRPSRPSGGVSLGPTLRFGGYFTAGQVVLHLLNNVDKILVGALLGERALGLYGQAFALMMKPGVVITAPLSSVMLPALSRSVHDRQSYAQIVLAFQRLLAVASFPAGIGLALVADDLMPALGGPQWAPAGPLLAVLSLTVLTQGFISMAGSIFVSAGRWRAMLIGLLVMLVLLVVGLWVGYQLGRRYGDPSLGVAWGYSLTTCVALFFPYMLFCLRLVGVSPVAWLRQLARPAVAAVGMGLVVFLARQVLMSFTALPPLGMLIAEVSIGVAAYVAFAWREIRWCIERMRSSAAG